MNMMSDSSGEENENGSVAVISTDQPTDNSSLGLHQVSVVRQQPDESAPEVHYVETLTFDPDTGLYTTSATPTIIETDGSYALPIAETPVEEPITEQLIPATEQLIPATERLIPATEQLIPATEQLIPATEQLMPVDQQSDYVETNVNNSRSRRKMTSVTGSRQENRRSTDNSEIVCLKCGKHFARVSWIPYLEFQNVIPECDSKLVGKFLEWIYLGFLALPAGISTRLSSSIVHWQFLLKILISQKRIDNFLAPPADWQWSFSNADLSVVCRRRLFT